MNRNDIPKKQEAPHAPELTAETPKQKNKLLWTLLFFLIAGASIWAVTKQNDAFSPDAFREFLSQASPGWLVAAAAAMLTFIIAEGAAIRCISRDLGYKTLRRDGFFYSAADIYFSAITPSATGGQPACAYFMIRDGIPGSVTTVVLLLNITMYSFSILVVGLICFLLFPSLFLWFSAPAKVLIILGFAVQALLATFLFLLLTKERFLHGICDKVLRFLSKLHLIRHVEKKQQKLQKVMDDYQTCAKAVVGHRKMLIKTFFLNLLQRTAQISVTMFAFLAVGGETASAFKIEVLQSFAVLGSNCVPIPGAMGVADYLMLNGFQNLMDEASAVNLELLSRTISFYVCTLLCGAAAVIKYFIQRSRKEKK